MSKQLLCLLLTLPACGSRAVVGRVQDQPYQAYADQRFTAVGTSGTTGTVSVTSPDGNNCITIVGGKCVAATRSGPYCSGATSGPVDVVIVDGVTKATVCYPSPSDSQKPVTVSDPSQTPNVTKTANGAAIVFDASTDGKPIKGPVTLSANDVSLYGNGPDKTIIDGDLIIEKNNARVRGVHVKGNVVVKFNDVSVMLCEIDGNLTSDKNNGLFSTNTVHGNISLSGSGNQVYYNAVEHDLSASGASCAGNVKIPSGDALTCP